MANMWERKAQEAKKHRRTIAEQGLPDVTRVDVDTALVAIRHAIEKAELVFTKGGDLEKITHQEEAALRRVRLAVHDYEQRAERYREQVEAEREQEEEKRREASDRLAQSIGKATIVQMWLAGAITAATIVQAAVATLQLVGGQP